MAYEIAISLTLLGVPFLMFFLAMILNGREEQPLRLLFIVTGLFLTVFALQITTNIVTTNIPATGNETQTNIRDNMQGIVNGYQLVPIVTIIYFILMFVIYYMRKMSEDNNVNRGSKDI